MSGFGLVSALAEGQLPDVGQIYFVPTAAFIWSLLAGVYGYLASGSREEAEVLAFVGGLIGGGLALIAYLGVLIGGVL